MVTANTISLRDASRLDTWCSPALQFRSAHLVGVGGSGMKALAELLIGLGWKVSGSDQQLSDATSEMFAKRGLRVHQGHHGRFVPEGADVLVYSPAVGPRNPERQHAAVLGIPQYSYSQMLGYLMRDQVGICVSGTHGKSTTTAMTGSILASAGLSPSVVVGAEIRGINASGWAGQGELFVVESCEYQRHFLDLNPRHIAILSIEPDHFDCFPSLDETVSAFADFANKVPPEGSILVRGDCTAAKSACVATSVPVETFSLLPSSTWWAADLRTTPEGTRFRVFYQGEYFAEMAVRIPGQHNVLNALAATALCHRVGVGAGDIREGLFQFAGIRRRFEPVGSWRGVTLIDDYAHHPTAVACTLQTAREKYARRKIWCVFQPHQVSRTTALLKEFSESFSAADEVVVLPVYAARERVRHEPRDVSQSLAQAILAQGGHARFCSSLDQAVTTLEDGLRPGDVLITMGAGDIGQVHHAFTRRLPRNHSPR